MQPETDDYGIEKAIELMRTLPGRQRRAGRAGREVLARVGRHQAAGRSSRTRSVARRTSRAGSACCSGEIGELEQEIKTRKDEIDRLDTDYKETTTVRERLELAENIGKPKPAAASSTGSVSGGGHEGATRRRRAAARTRQTAPPPLEPDGADGADAQEVIR